MICSFRPSFTRVAYSLAAMLGIAAPALAAPFGGALYETFGAGGVTGIELANSSIGVGALKTPGTAIATGGSTVYFASGDTVYSTNASLIGLTVFHRNNAAPAGLAVDTTGGFLYETFGASSGVIAINLANPATSAGVLRLAATSIVEGGGKVYFASGDTIYSANPNLTGVSIFHTNSAATTSLALDAADGILYDAFGAGGLVGLDLANPGHAVGILGLEANNVAFGNGTVYFDSGDTIYATNPDLVGLTAFHSNNAPVDGLALLPPVLGASLGAAVPEPSATGVIGLGLIGLARLHRRRRPSKAAG
jgi:hypothetical protein